MGTSEDTPEWYKTITHGSDNSYTSDSAREVRRLQEQCYLIDNWRQFVSYSMLSRGRAGDGFSNFTPIHGGSPESLVSLLAGKTGTQILFDMTPAQKALLVPKIRIFKSYLSKDAGTKNVFDDIEVHFPSEAFNSEDISSITKTKFGRGHGVGIKSFEWTYDGKDPAQVKYSTKCKMTMFFQNLEDFTKSRPVLNPKKNGPKTYRFSDIINPFEAEHYQKSDGSKTRTDDDSLWRLKATVGWSQPGKNSSGLFSKSLLEAIDECVVVLYLTVTTHEISFNQDGSLEVTVDFVGALENALTDPSADVFMDPKWPNVSLAGNKGQGAGNQQLEKLKAELARRNRKAKPGDPTPNAASEGVGGKNRYVAGMTDEQLRSKIKYMQNSIGKENAKSRLRRHARLMEDLIMSQKIQVATVQPQELGIFGEKQLTAKAMASFRRARIEGTLTEDQLKAAGVGDQEVIKKLLSRDFLGIGTLQIFDPDHKFHSSERSKGVRGSVPVGGALEDSNKFLGADAHKDKYWASRDDSGDGAATTYSKMGGGGHFFGEHGYVDDDTSKAVKAIKADYSKVITKLDSAASLNQRRDAADGADVPLYIQYMYFGDIIDAAMKALQNHKDRDDMRVLLGDLYFSDPFTIADQSSRKAQINLADIPVSMNMFQVWFFNRVVKRDLGSMSTADFIKDIISYLITPVFGSACVGPLAESAPPRTFLNVKTFSFNAPGGKGGADRLGAGDKSGRLYFRTSAGGAPSSNGVVAGSHSTPAQGAKNITLQTPSGVAPTRIFNYSLMHATIHDMNRLEGNEAHDSANGIYHLRVGADRGLAKKFNFKAETRKYAAEAQVVDKSQRSNIEGLRGSKYNCDIEMIGNPLFQNGQYVFIDPSMMGFGNFGAAAYEKNQKLLRLGGYYLIIEVQCSVDIAGFNTTLKCLWENFPNNYRGSRYRSKPSVEQLPNQKQSNVGAEVIDPAVMKEQDLSNRAARAAKVDAARGASTASLLSKAINKQNVR